MTEQQALNTLKWVDALLSGQFKHGKDFMFNPSTETHTALGVAMEAFGLPIEPGTPSNRLGGWPHMGWYHKTFGGSNKSPFMMQSINDHSTNYYAVASLLLDAVPSHSATVRRQYVELKDKLNKLIAEVKYAKQR